jgi:hypothetical protein
MTVTTETTNLRTHARYQLVSDSPVPVCVEWKSGNESHKCDARLVDLSANGARIRLPQHVELHETIEVRLRVKKLSVDFQCAAEVCWSQPFGNEWVLGCAFDSELPEHVLVKLAGNGYINRRTDPRFSIDLTAEVREELGANEWLKVTLDNYSSGGFRLRSMYPIAVGQRVLLSLQEFEQQVAIPGRALWQVETEEGYSVGCSFLNGDGFDRLTSIVRREDSQPVPSRRRSIRISPLAWLALVTTIFVVSQQETFVASLRMIRELWQ